MGSRKESIKKTLGISEYPWSSDDEDEMPVQVVRTQQSAADVRGGDPNTPGPSGSGSVSSAPTSSRRDSGFWSLSLNPPRLSDSGGSVSVRRPREDMALNYIPRSSSNERTGAQDVQRVLAFRSLRRQALPTNVIYRPSYGSGLTRAASTSHLMRDSEQTFIAEMAARMRQSISPTQNEMARQPASNNVYLENPMQSNSVPASSSRDERDEMTMDPETEAIVEEADGSGAPQETSAMSLEEEVVEIDGDAEPEAQQDAEPPQESQEPPLEDEPIPTTSSASEPPPQAPQPHGVKRKRESEEDTSEIASVKDFNQSLLRLLECPVCLEWMEPPMWQCRRGHLVCGRCRARLQACPVCRTAFSSVRNRAMEGVAEMIRYPCRHGCGRDLQLRRRGTHEASCAARRYPCPAPACDQRPPLAHPDLTAHIHSKHLSMVKVGRKHKFSMKVNSEQHDNWIISALHQLFHLRVDVDIRTWGVVVYVAYIGPKCNADDYTYEVTVIGQHNSRKLVYTRATHCDLECSTLNVSRQDCFHLTLDQALNFLRVKNRHCEPDKYLNFNVEISSNTNQDDSDS